jgi:riboflavin synthase alpha subunit
MIKFLLGIAIILLCLQAGVVTLDRMFLTVENITSHSKLLTEIPTTPQKTVNRNR